MDTTNPNDSCDSVGGTPVGNGDCDNDGLTNDEETTLGTDPADSDSDEDGILDGQEVEDNTSPLDDCDSIGGTPVNPELCENVPLPNEDDISILNDVVDPNLNNGSFQIENIELFPNNTVTIFNRWGVKVFETIGYDNNDNAFRGISNGRVTISSNEELPVGVYYYVINYTRNDEGKSKAGYLYINR